MLVRHIVVVYTSDPPTPRNEALRWLGRALNKNRRALGSHLRWQHLATLDGDAEVAALVDRIK